MKKHIAWALIALIAAPSPALAQESILPTLEALRREYPPDEMTPAQRGELLNRVAWIERAQGWGLHRKPGGNRCPQPGGVEVSCDILVHGPTWSVYDVLIDESIPTEAYKGPINDPANFVPPTAPAGGVTVPPVVVPPVTVPPVDTAPLLTRLDHLDAQTLEIVHRLAGVEQQTLEVKMQLEAHDHGNPFANFFTDGKTIAAIASAAGTLLAAWAANK